MSDYQVTKVEIHEENGVAYADILSFNIRKVD